MVAAAVAFGLLAQLMPATPVPPAPVPLAQAPVASVIARPEVLTERSGGEVPGRAVALTFDDGPDPRWTPQVLALLRRHGVVATFCIVTEKLPGNEHLIREIVEAGMRLCNHTRTHHGDLPARGARQRADEIDGARADIAAVTDAPVLYFRAPEGNWSDAVAGLAARRGMQPLGWSVDPRDWRQPGTRAIVSAVQQQVRPGAVVLLHDGGGRREQTVAALAELLPWLAANGYRCDFPTP